MTMWCRRTGMPTVCSAYRNESPRTRTLLAADRVRGRPGLAIRCDDKGDDRQDRGSRTYQDYTGDAHEDPVLACLSLLVPQREPGSGRVIARGRIVQVDTPASARAKRAAEINHDVCRLSRTRPACAEAGELDSCWAELLRAPGLRI